MLNSTNFDLLCSADSEIYQKSSEGYALFVTGIHPEATEDLILDFFSDFGRIINLKINHDNRSGLLKGYVLIVYSQKSEAESCIHSLNGKKFLDKVIHLDYAFMKN